MQKQFLIFTDLLICKIHFFCFYSWKKKKSSLKYKVNFKEAEAKELSNNLYYTNDQFSSKKKKAGFQLSFFIQQKVCCQLNAFNDKHIKKVNKRIFQFIHFTSKICWFLSSFHFWLGRKSLSSKIMTPFLQETKTSWNVIS